MKAKIKYLVALFAVCLTFILTGVNAEASIQTDQTEKAITIKWNPTAGATGYTVQYMKHGDSAVTTKSGITETSYTISGLTPGTCYAVNVLAVVGGKQQSVVKEFCYTLPSKVTGITMSSLYSNAKGTVHIATVRWKNLDVESKQKAVDGYEYVVKNNAGTVVDSGEKLAARFSTDKIKSKGIYTVQVRAYIDLNSETKLYGPWSDTTTLIPQPLVSTLPRKTGILAGGKLKVSWKKQTGATGYDIYVSTSPSSGYKKVKSVGKKSSTTVAKDGNDKAFQGNTTYYVVVVGKKGKATSIIPNKGNDFEYYPVRRSAWLF